MRSVCSNAAATLLVVADRGGHSRTSKAIDCPVTEEMIATSVAERSGDLDRSFAEESIHSVIGDRLSGHAGQRVVPAQGFPK